MKMKRGMCMLITLVSLLLIGNVSEIKPLKEQPGWDGTKPVAVEVTENQN